MIKTVKDVKLNGKRVIMRADFNVPMKDGAVQDDTRIRAALPTINYILGCGVRSLVLMSHLGDPDKDVKKAEEKAAEAGRVFDRTAYIKSKHTLKPVADYLAQLLGKNVEFADSCLHQSGRVAALPDGGILMLENTRFHKEEKSKDSEEKQRFAKELSGYGDVFVNDAFGTAHRDHASTAAIAEFVPVCVGGLLMEKEIRYLEPMLNNPPKPMTAVIGGAKVSSKIGVLESLIKNASTLIIGGGMAYTFLKAQGHSIGKSIVETDYLETARMLSEKAAAAGTKIILPKDHICAKEFSANAAPVEIDGVEISGGLIAMDVGKKTLAEYGKAIAASSSIIWNGPVGVFEFDAFAKGTEFVAQSIAAATAGGALTVVGGGDSIAAVNKFGLGDKMSHISTGGGASLEFLEGKILPGIACLETV